MEKQPIKTRLKHTGLVIFQCSCESHELEGLMRDKLFKRLETFYKFLCPNQKVYRPLGYLHSCVVD